MERFGICIQKNNLKLGEQFVFNDNELLCYVNCGHKRIKTEDFSGICKKYLYVICKLLLFYTLVSSKKDVHAGLRPNVSSNGARGGINSIN